VTPTAFSSRRLVATLACRAGGTRLYGKPLQLLDIARHLTVLEYMLQFFRTEPTVADTVLGVAVGPENEPFHAIARRQGLVSITGDERDVLLRLIQCAEAAGATDVFRVTTESPFTYFEPIPAAWHRHLERGNDLTAVMDVPDGAGFEIIRVDALRRSHRDGDTRHRSELCSLYIREHRADFRVDVLPVPPELDRMDLRLTIDYPEDLIVCRRVYERFADRAPRIALREIITFLDSRPDLVALIHPLVSGERLYA
jgi:spore coat polysaccharide biosynthesis protein SpsF